MTQERKNRILSPCEMGECREYTEKMRQLNEGKGKKVFVLTFGCQQNEADSEKLAGMSMDMGYTVTKDPQEADLILVNTCAIREHAEKKALSIIGQYKHIKAARPETMIGVCGCMVVQEHRAEEIKFRYPYVDFIFGTSSLHRFPKLLYDKITKGKRLYCPQETDFCVAEGLRINRESNYRAWVSIMYGCNNFCSYCIVPYVRGRERSREMHEIVAEVRDLAQRGYKDITLLGQNVNSYAKDSDFDYDFADLMAELAKIEGDFLLRFMTSHPKDASKKLIDTMAQNPKIARHFHLPMQSGSDEILAKMNRRYDTKKYLETVDYLREKIPGITITTDIIVGFPGETEEDFEETLNMLRRVKFDMIYSFIYSPRKGTPAAEMECQIPDSVKSERFNRLLAVQNEIAFELNQQEVGKTLRVLCDGISKNNEKVYSGRTEGNKIVFFDGDESDTGKYINVKIDRAEAFALYGQKV